MAKTTIALMSAALLLCAGCVVPSLNGIYTPETAVFEPGLIGHWAEQDSDVEYEFMQADGESYAMLMTNVEGKESRYTCNLVQLKGILFLDLYPADVDEVVGAYAPWNFVPMHTFFMVKFAGDELVVLTINPEWLMDLHFNQPAAIAVAPWQFEDGDTLPMLTATTEELQEFIAGNVATPDAFYAEMHLSRSGS